MYKRHNDTHPAFRLFGMALMAATMMLHHPAHADAGKDVAIMSKVVGFVKNGPKGEVPVAIVVDGSNPTSVAHGDEIVAKMNGAGGGKVKLKGEKVDISALSGASQPVLFVTKGMNAHYGAISTKIKGGTLSMSNDPACLGAACVITVQSSPSVEIALSSETANAAGIEFASAFSMMVTKK